MACLESIIGAFLVVFGGEKHGFARKMCTFAIANAEIAQLVEHNLAKVGVAGPSPVFRSFFVGEVAELVDALL